MTNVDVLNSWKEVAAYLGRGVRTVQRWEQELGLPVRRPRGKSRSAVIAFRAELDSWLHRAQRNEPAVFGPAAILHAAPTIQLPDIPPRKNGHLFDQTHILMGKTHQLLNRSLSLCERSRFLCTEVTRMVATATSTLEKNRKETAEEISPDKQDKQMVAT